MPFFSEKQQNEAQKRQKQILYWITLMIPESSETWQISSILRFQNRWRTVGLRDIIYLLQTHSESVIAEQ